MNRPGRVALALLATLLLVSLAACGSQGAGDVGPAESEVKIVARDNSFEPGSVKVPSGKAVKVTFVNEGKNVHEVEIKDLIAETKLQPGESRSFTIKPAKKPYRLYCEIHEDKGMVGEFIGE